MNDASLKELKIIVERVVRPVRATLARKRQMREELLAHLVSIFEEEAIHGDERAALERAKQRFGDPKELSGQLRQTVPWGDQAVSVIERFDRQPGESLLHLVGKQLVTIIVGCGVMLGWALPWIIVLGRIEVGVAVRAFLVACLVGYGFCLLLLLVPVRMGRALYGAASERSLRAVVFYGLLSLSVFPVMSFLTCWVLTGDLALSLTDLRLACYFAPVAPVVFLVMARKMTEEMRYREEWGSLEIGE